MSLAYMVWSITVRSASELAGDSEVGSSLGGIIVGSLLKSLVMGPIGAALCLIWERDQLVWQREEDSNEKSLKGRPRRMSRKWMFS